MDTAQAVLLIDGTCRLHGVAALLASLGFTQSPLPLDSKSRSLLGLPEAATSAAVAVGEGALRALVVEVTERADVRDCINLLALQLSRAAPQLLWLLIVSQHDSHAFAIATWRCDRSVHVPAVAAMITQRERVLNSDAETVCALAAAAAAPNDVMRHMRWLDILGRDAVTRRFFRALSGAVNTLAISLTPRVAVTDAREIAILTASRLLFLSFLETKGWLNSDFGFLANGFTECMAVGGAYQRRVLEPLFFGTLNTRVSERAAHARAFGRIPFLNGGLFCRTGVERVHRAARFSDDALGELFGDVLVRYRFTAREHSPTWSQSAVDPEMLGKVFESLMESGDRKRGGVYYTPQRFVERTTYLAIGAALRARGLASDRVEQILTDPATLTDPHALETVRGLRVLDPACGSGAFLVHVLERLAGLRTTLGDTAAPSDLRRSVLTRSIFGVDSNPTAVWLCELRLWLAAVMDSDERDCMRIAPLPNLDRQIRIGDSLAGDAFDVVARTAVISSRTRTLRARYTRASGPRKLSLGRSLDAMERSRAAAALDASIIANTFERKDLLRAARTRDLFDERGPMKPSHRDRLLTLRTQMRVLRRKRVSISRGGAPDFSYPTHFADVADAGGFDAIIGNPPWVRIHNVPPGDRARYRETFRTCRASAWSDGARGANASIGFAGQVDLAALFAERAVDLLAPTGVLGLLLPSKLWRSLAGGGTRQLLLDRTNIIAVEDHADAPDAFDAAVYPSVMVAARSAKSATAQRSNLRVAVQRRDAFPRWTTSHERLALDDTPGSPWLLIPPAARTAFEHLSRAGVPLFESSLRRPHLGVKTGCNDAFIVRGGVRQGETTSCSAGCRTGVVETRLLRPLVRGETLTRWRFDPTGEYIVWTHDTSGKPLPALPDNAQLWLTPSRRALERRTDSRSARWWSLFRIESAACSLPRVVWNDFGRAPRAAVLHAGDRTVPLNTCYSVACATTDDALAFAAMLNSRIAAAWLAAIAEPARGGYHRYLGWTVARLPVPKRWTRAREILAPIAAAAAEGNEPTASDLDAAVLTAYGLNSCVVEPLLAWIDAGTVS